MSQPNYDRAIREQDEALGQLGRGVDRLHNLAQGLNEESKLHTGLLEDMGTDVEKTAVGLRNETKHAEQIRESSQNCWMYICIVVLLVILVLLLIIGFQ